MTNRVVVISQPASLHYSKKQIIIEFEWGKSSEKIPLEDLSVLLLENRQISLTSSVLYYCAEYNVALITCDDRHHPVALSQPLAKQTLHSKIFRKHDLRLIVELQPLKVRLQRRIEKLLH